MRVFDKRKIGKKHTPETIEKLRVIARNRKRKPHSIETKIKIGLKHKGKVYGSETRRKISIARLGKPLSAEHIEKIRLASLGRVYPTRRGVKLPPFSEERRRNMSEAQRGHKAHNWQGGLRSINTQIRKSFEYKLWREAVFKRDNYTCVWCGIRSGNGKAVILNADHIKPFSLFPELRFSIDNGRTLCVGCHRTTDNYGGNSRKK